MTDLGIVVGLDQEAALVRGWGRVAIGGGTFDGALKAAEVLATEFKCTALISFGVAGGLDPALTPGTVLAASEVFVDGQTHRANLIPPGIRQARLLGARDVVTTVAEKATLWSETRCAAVDLETGAVVLVARRHRLPWGALRAICDPASRTLPPLASEALEDGSIRFGRVLRSLLRRPGQLPELLKLANDARLARAALMTLKLAPLGSGQAV